MKPNTPNIAEIISHLRAEAKGWDGINVKVPALLALCDEVERQSEENTDLSKRLNHALNERDGSRRAAEAYRKDNQDITKLLDSANNAIEPIKSELDYERQENDRLRKALESIATSNTGLASSLKTMAGEALRRDTKCETKQGNTSRKAD